AVIIELEARIAEQRDPAAFQVGSRGHIAALQGIDRARASMFRQADEPGVLAIAEGPERLGISRIAEPVTRILRELVGADEFGHRRAVVTRIPDIAELARQRRAIGKRRAAGEHDFLLYARRSVQTSTSLRLHVAMHRQDEIYPSRY